MTDIDEIVSKLLEDTDIYNKAIDLIAKKEAEDRQDVIEHTKKFVQIFTKPRMEKCIKNIAYWFSEAQYEKDNGDY